jgi:hypothetical protein
MQQIAKTGRDFRSLAACAAITLTVVGAAGAFPLQDAVAAAGAPVGAAAEPAQELRAVFIDVAGKVQWRANDKSPWKDAAVNDVVTAGAEVRTGLRSRAALRVGRNATALLDAGTTFALPTVLQDGETLRTTATVRAGRADFKVDRVGLTNDFRVVTPSTTLAVRGTEFAVMTGPLKQVEIVGARRNIINAIELRYALNNRTVSLSGAAKSTTGAENPAHMALLEAIQPGVGETPKTNEQEQVESAAKGPAPVESGGTGRIAKDNQSNQRSESEKGEVESSVNATIKRAIKLANERTDRAIEYLFHASNAADVVVAQKDVLAALKQLADTRRNEALAALALHQGALASAQGAMGDTATASAAFATHTAALNSQLDAFRNDRESATTLLQRIESVIAGQEEGDLRALAQQAGSALWGMNAALESAHGSYDNIAEQLRRVNEVIAGLDSTTRPQAAAAIASYQAAIAQLKQLASQGASPAQIAAAAQAAVSNLNALIQQLAGLAHTQGALAAASASLNALASANSALAQSQAALAAIRAARDAAIASGGSAQLGMVEQLYQQIVAIRAQMASSLLASAGLIDSANVASGETNSYADTVFALLGGYWRDAATVSAGDAGASANLAAQAAAQAVAAHGQFEAAVAGAQGVLANAEANYAALVGASGAVSDANAHLQQVAGTAMAALGLVPTGGHDAFTQALVALDALEQALGGILAQYQTFQGIAGQQGSGADVAGYQAQGAAALQALLQALANAQAASAAASGSANAAHDAAQAAAAVRDLALQLAERFGLEMNGALAAAAQAYAQALAAGGSAQSAAQSAQQAQALALLANANAISGIASQIDALLAQSGSLSAAALAELTAAHSSYQSVNEYGTTVFAGLSMGEANGALGLLNSAQQSYGALSEMATTSTAYVRALDGAENAAKGAERAEIGARGERIKAEDFSGRAGQTYAQMNQAIGSSDYRLAASLGYQVGQRAGQADGAAQRSAGYAQEAVGYYQTAQAHGQVADSLQAIIHTYGATSAEFAAAAAALNGNVQGANAAMGEVRARADFYNEIAQMLAGRANTDPARAAALQSGDAHTQVLAIAAQLAETAQNAGQMELTARTNAERMFYRSARQYVERAGGAAQRALDESQKARDAANLAAELARQAAEKASALPPGGASRTAQSTGQ